MRLIYKDIYIQIVRQSRKPIQLRVSPLTIAVLGLESETKCNGLWVIRDDKDPYQIVKYFIFIIFIVLSLLKSSGSEIPYLSNGSLFFY